MKKLLILLPLLMFANVGFAAYEYITGKVTRLAPELPDKISIWMDAGTNTCPSGKWLIWKGRNLENTKAVYTTLMTALVGKKRISFIVDKGDTTCTGKHIHLLSD